MSKRGLKPGDICIIVTSNQAHTENNLGRAVTLEKFVPANSGHLEFRGSRYQCISEDGWIVSGEDLWSWTMAQGYHKHDHTGVYEHRLRKIGDKDGFKTKSTDKEVTA